MIKLTTNHGVITLELDAEKAPKSAAISGHLPENRMFSLPSII